MNALFGNLKTDGIEEAEDRIGGFKVFETDAYTGKIKLAYAGKAPSGAQSVTIAIALPDGEYRETFWVTNKAGENWYVDKNDKTKQRFLPGFTVVDDICLVTIDKSLIGVGFEEKVINLYDPDQKKEVATTVQMITELLDKEVTLGIQKHLKNKQKKNAAGVYEDIAEDREENVVDKVFHFPSNLTTVEARKKVQQAAFYGAWLERNKGQTQDRRSIKNGESGQNGKAGRPGVPPQAGEAAAKTASLFG